jgi:hypothetical protein
MEPRTPEGVVAARLAFAPGVFIRAGQVGVVTGFDWGALGVLIPPHGDRERVISLLQVMENGVLEGSREAAQMVERRGAAARDFAKER